MTNLTAEDFQTQYQAVANHCGFLPLGNWTSISIRGSDRNRFLHNMCTNEINKLGVGEGCEAFFTDVKGKIVAHTIVLAREEEIVLLMVPNLAEQLISHLDRYVIREDVQIQNESDRFTWLAVLGPEASQILGLISTNNVGDLVRAWQNKLIAISGAAKLVTRFEAIYPQGFLLRCPIDSVDEVAAMLVDSSAKSISEPVWTAIRIESGLPLFGADFDNSNLPQEVSRNEQTINFNKGCYLGQETIARIDALGHVNKQVVTLQFSGDNVPSLGTKVTEGEKEVGEVTSVSWSPRANAPLALATIRRGSNQIGQKLGSDYGEVIVIANSLARES